MYPPPTVRESNAAAPAPVTDHCASRSARSEPVAAPIVIVPPALFPMVVFAVPVVLMRAVPVVVNPPVPVSRPVDVMVPVPLVEISPEVVMSSPAVTGERTVPALFQ